MRPASRIPYGFAKRHGVLALGDVPAGNDPGAGQGERVADAGEAVEVLFRPGVDPLSLVELRRALDRPLRLREIGAGEFDSWLERVYQGDGGNAAQMIDDLEKQGLELDLDLEQIARALPQPEDLLESADDAPIIRLINALLTEAIKEGASDIHIESFENALRVRFRVDGVLREAVSPPRALGPLLVSRVKVMAQLDIAEKRLPQDGRISLRVAGRPVDVRVATIPTGHGERVVMRLLDKREGRLDLAQLGLGDEARARLAALAERPHGILLVTGPTGSGKTTTLYALLNHLNDRRRNIMTVEDPIEYYLEGVSQTQVNSKVDMSFARGLRAILRQDPDIVMVGEIRDLETAEIAVQASLTGHLVLSTLHTNSAVGALTRLRDMGVEPFLLASSLIGVLAQRLVRVLCPHCRTRYTASPADCQLLGVPVSPPPSLYGPGPNGCGRCNGQGYRRRSGVFELVPVDAAMKTLIHDGAAEQALERHARTLSPSLYDNGRARLFDGTTSPAEFLRVIREA